MILELKSHLQEASHVEIRMHSRQKEKRATEGEIFIKYHRLSGHEFEQTSGDSEGEGSLACCSPWGCKELDTTDRLN